MKKILKVVRSRFFISGLVILLQFIQLVVVFSLLNHYSMIMTFLGYFFYIGVFLYIINKYASPEFKLPWIIFILLFFVVGAFVFILLMGNEENKKMAKKFKKNQEELSPYLVKNDNLNRLQKQNMDAYLQANYLFNTTGLPIYQNTNVKYYKMGKDYYEDLLKVLKSAKKFILMEYFIIEEGIMWNSIYDVLKKKVQEGVFVYLMYDDVGCMTTLDDDYYKTLKQDGIHALPFNKFRPVLSKIHNNRDHRKITVVDGLVGFTGGINLADEYINEKIKYGTWKDTGVMLEGEAVNSFTYLFLESWNTQSKVKLDPKMFMDKESKIVKSEGFLIPYGDGPEEFYSDNIGKYVYLNMLQAAKKYVYITTPYLICDYEILNSICLCAKKGVDVRIITPHIPDKKTVFLMTQSNYEMLISSGVKIYEYTNGFIHAKEFIADDIYATCGTINLDYRSLVHHFECGVWMYQVDSIKDMKNGFLETLKESEEITLKKAKLKGFKKIITEVMKVFFPLF